MRGGVVREIKLLSGHGGCSNLGIKSAHVASLFMSAGLALFGLR